jgi:hypothetical protein
VSGFFARAFLLAAVVADFPVRNIRYQTQDKERKLIYLVEWDETRMQRDEFQAFKSDPHEVISVTGQCTVVRWLTCTWILASSLNAPVDCYKRWVVHKTNDGEERRIGMGTSILSAEDDFPSE